jgi:ABC-type uncharacterized transport system involved in gliding motility auxiliary subunit
MKSQGAAKALAWLGLGLLVLGGLHHAQSLEHPMWGLAAAGAGLLCLLLAALLGRRGLARFLASRAARLGLGAGVTVLMVLATALFLGSLATRHHWRLDLTQDARHSLAPQTRQLLAQLEQPVLVYAFFRQDQPGRQNLLELLDECAFRSRRFTYRFVDPDREPVLAKRYDVRNYGAVVLTQGDKTERLRQPGEAALANALARLGRQGHKVAYLLSGHGEPALDDQSPGGLAQLAKALGQQDLELRPLLLAAQGQAPADAALLIEAAPRKPLAAAEIQALGRYLDQGGALLLLLDPERDGGLGDWLLTRGVVLDNDLILDQASSLVGASPAWPIVSEYGDHPATRPLAGMYCYFPLARSLRPAQPPRPGLTATALLETGPTSWGSTDLEGLKAGRAGFTQGRDLKGPLTLGLILEPSTARAASAQDPSAEPAPQGRLAVIGDSDFVANRHLDQAANRDLALNLVSHLARQGDGISLRPKEEANQPLLLRPGQAGVIFWLPVVVMPLIFVVLGLRVRRRRRRP